MATGAGVPMAWKAIQWKNAEINANNARDDKKPPV
jgi:hypothetical protein